MKIPENKRKNLIDRGYFLNVYFFEEFGELEQYGEVGNISQPCVKVGNLNLKKGDKWVERMDKDTFKLSFSKLC